jgi:glycosyltransferase 2 family protein
LFTKYKKKILLSVSFGAIIFLIFSLYADFNNLLDAFSQFNWVWFPLVLLLSFSNYIIRFFKWQYYLGILNIKIKSGTSFMIFISSFVMSVTPGKMGEVLKSFLLKEETGTPVSISAPIILAERITDFLSIVLLCIAGAVIFDYGKSIIILTGVAFIVLVLILSSKTVSFKIISYLSRINFISRHSEKIYASYNSISELIRLKPLIYGLILSCIAWFLECLGFFIVINVFTGISGLETGILSATFIYAFSTLIGAIAMLPGGLGATEATLTGLLLLLKIPRNISVASAMIIRVATLWFAVLLGLITVQIYQRKTHHRIADL